MKLKKKQEDWSLWFQLAEWVICFVKLDISLHIALSVGSHRPRPLPHEKFWEHNRTQYMLLKHTVLNSPFSTTVSLHMPKYLQNWCPPFLWFLKPSPSNLTQSIHCEKLTYFTAVARYAVLVLSLIVVLPTALTVRSISVSCTVQTVPTMSSPFI